LDSTSQLKKLNPTPIHTATERAETKKPNKMISKSHLPQFEAYVWPGGGAEGLSRCVAFWRVETWLRSYWNGMLTMSKGTRIGSARQRCWGNGGGTKEAETGQGLSSLSLEYQEHNLLTNMTKSIATADSK
jgi:hypothetical protein